MKISRQLSDRSSFIASWGYCSKTKKLNIAFQNKKRYTYSKVPTEIITELLQAESIGRAYNEYVKGAYESEEV
jgi:hypothetical protein